MIWRGPRDSASQPAARSRAQPRAAPGAELAPRVARCQRRDGSLSRPIRGRERVWGRMRVCRAVPKAVPPLHLIRHALGAAVRHVQDDTMAFLDAPRPAGETRRGASSQTPDTRKKKDGRGRQKVFVIIHLLMGRASDELFMSSRSTVSVATTASRSPRWNAPSPRLDFSH